MKPFFVLAFLAISLFSCQKETPSLAPVFLGFTEFRIAAGNHYCDQTAIRPVTVSEMAFVVKFDSSAIYKTLNPVTQYDINKLYGFTEGTDPHLNSARIGWSWNDHALRLYAYAYKNGERFSKEIAITPLNKEIICKISVAPGQYSFSVDGVTEVLPRAELPVPATGYQLFPYFGGDETAPSRINIFIKEINSIPSKI